MLIAQGIAQVEGASNPMNGINHNLGYGIWKLGKSILRILGTRFGTFKQHV
jgi:hypothetical protein